MVKMQIGQLLLNIPRCVSVSLTHFQRLQLMFSNIFVIIVSKNLSILDDGTLKKRFALSC